MEKKKVLMDALVLNEDRFGHATLTEEKRWEELTYYANDRVPELCNLCMINTYPDCRKDCLQHQMWRRRTGATL